jgi:hypothetical protein
VYIDFAKAFDSVVKSKLCAKLYSMGIRGKLLLWISVFLTDRTQQVKVSKCLSDVVNVVSGVPQGSVLGPLLFVTYINDIVNIFDSKLQVKLFADDVKIYIVIDDVTCTHLLQKGLDNLAIWAAKWQLNISVPKCSVLHIGCLENRPSYHINNCTLPNVTSVKDLGVTMDSKLRFRFNLNSIVSKAHQRASLIM